MNRKLSDIVLQYFEENNLPYAVVEHRLMPEPLAGIRHKDNSGGWLGWIYYSEFRSFDHSDMNAPGGLIKRISAADPEFFSKLIEWLPECAARWSDFMKSNKIA